MYTVSVRMSLAQRSLSLAGIIGILTAVFAGGLIYLLVTQPVSTAENIAQGEVSPIVKAVAGVLYDALRGILKFL
jgi:multidrug resistance efflux pump